MTLLATVTRAATASVTINVTRSHLRAAPEGMNFDLTLSGFDTNTLPDQTVYDPSFHDKVVLWDFGDGYTFTAPGNVASEYMNSRYGYGPLGSHTFRSAGNHTVMVTVIEPSSGKTAFGVLYIGGAQADTPAILDPDAVFPGAQTYYVDNTGAHTNAPSGAQTFTNTLAAVSRLIADNQPGRIMLARDQTHEISADIYWRPGSNNTTLRIEAEPGGGASPILTQADGWAAPFGRNVFLNDEGSRSSGGTLDLVFSNINFLGPWDAATETVQAGRKNVILFQSGGFGSDYVLFDDCTMDGWSIALWPGVQNNAFIVNDCTMTNWENMAISDSSRVFSALMGCAIRQHVDAMSGGDKDRPDPTNVHGPLRVYNPGRFVMQGCDLFSRCGWFGAGSIRAQQECVRFGTNRSPGAKGNFHGNVMESSGKCFESIITGGADPYALNLVVDSNFMLGGYDSDCIIRLTNTGWTIRNNILVFADIERDRSVYALNGETGSFNPNSFIRFFDGPVYNHGPGVLETPVLAYHNTCINLMSDERYSNNVGGVPSVFGGGQFIYTGRNEENNISHHPNLNTPTVPFAPLTASVFMTPAMTIGHKISHQFANAGAVLAGTATPADSGQIFHPAAGSSALAGATTGRTWPRDFFGNTRPGTPAVGALETI